MPPSKLPEFIERLESLEKALTKHLIEGSAVKNDLVWLKRAFWTIAGAFVFAAGSVLVSVISHLMRS